jgi:hypothetical protein
MGTQRYISTSFYDDRWIQSLDPAEKFIYLYLLTNPLTNIAGVYKIEDRRISFDTGYTKEVVGSILEKFEKAGKVYRMDEYIVIPSWPKHQKWEKAPKIKQGIISCLMEIGEEYLKKLVIMNYKFDLRIVFDTLSIPYERVFSVDHDSEYPSNYSDLDLDIDIISGGSKEPPFSDSQKPEKPEKPKKPSLMDREPENDMERVEKAYRQNWTALFNQGQVKTQEPIVNWGQTRALLKKHFEKLKPDQIIRAVNSGMKDDWVMNHGYSLGIILSAVVLNRLINAHLPEEKQFGKPSEGTVDINALYKQFGLTGSEAEKRRKLIELRDQGRVSF